MVYPASPFTNKFNTSTIINLNSSNISVGTSEDANHLDSLLQWLCRPPKLTSFRVNTLKTTPENARNLIQNKLQKVTDDLGRQIPVPNVSLHHELKDVVLVNSYAAEDLDLNKREKEVIVDAACGTAILRGAHVYAPGIMGMLTGTKQGDLVSVYADITKSCKKGLNKIYDCPLKVFVGNGIIRQTRNDIFGENLTPSGIAVEITDSLAGCPTLNESYFPSGSLILQNIPSIICGHVLNPKPGEVVLDMCAAPGNKTTHLAALMQNTGTLIAIDKIQSKIKHLENKLQEFSITCVRVFGFDSTKSCDENLDVLPENYLVENGPPFSPKSFDKILLDAPCSGLGNRPQLLNTITDKIVRSYIPLQRKLFKTAVQLLKNGGHLVYSTCSITLAENEGLVSWALDTFDSLELLKADPILGGPGWSGTNLTQAQLKCVQRFGPDQSEDSIGFFIAHFRKK